MFSSILDISSFFIGMLINLLLIVLICYYFKRKYEALEQSQNEQAKILYTLIQNQTPSSSSNFDINELIKNSNLKNKVMADPEELLDDDDTSDDESESSSINPDDDVEVEDNIKILSVKDNIITEDEMQEIPNITVTKIEDTNMHMEELVNTKTDSEVESESEPATIDYSKLSIKELKDILSKKGINSNNRMKKNDLINLIENKKEDTSLKINLDEEVIL